MDEKDLNRYINKNFEKWLQYSKFICNKVGIANEAEDVIQEVICMLFEKKGVKGLLELIEKKTEDGSELDYYVLNVIKGNCMLPNAPYMWRYHKDPCTGNWDMDFLT